MGHRPRRQVLALAGALALLAGVGGASIAGAQGQTCGPGNQACVILIQVDGLEAQDVTLEKMPFTWALAHPGPLTPEGAIAAALGERDGWIWEASRAAMTAGVGANTVSLLTGGYPQQHGVPSDEFYKVTQVPPDEKSGAKLPTFPGSGSEPFRLESDPDDLNTVDREASPFSGEIVTDGTQTLLHLVDDEGGKPAAFVGDPDLGKLLEDAVGTDDRFWAPGTQSADTNDQQYWDPAGYPYCDTRRELNPFEPPVVDHQAQYLRSCAVRDEVVLRKAFDVLSTASQGGDSRLAYIELAEVGHIKRLTTDPQAIESALIQTDFALAEFFNRYTSPQSAVTSQKWANTVVFLVGSGGYEPAENFVRDPDSTLQDGGDLAGIVKNHPASRCGNDESCFRLVPQGSVATVYYRQGSFTGKEDAENPTATHLKRVQQLRKDILDLNGDTACAATATETDLGVVGPRDCIEEVLYMRPELAPAGQKNLTVEAQHPDWNLDNEFFDIDRDTFEEIHLSTGSSGDLLVVMAPGWRSGRPAPGASQELLQGLIGAGEPDHITGPYPGVSGGPRNRSIAALVNGPQDSSGIRNLRSVNTNFDYYPVGTTSQGGPDDPKPTCDPRIVPKYADQPGNPAVVQANSPETTDLADDANAPGHECQAEIADIGLTIAGLMKLPVRFQQIGGRLLYEAFDEGVMPPTIGERPRLLQPKAFLTAGPLVAGQGQDLPHNFDGLPIFGFVSQPDKGEVVYECILLPGQVAVGDLPTDLGAWETCGDAPSERPDLCQNVVDEDKDGEPERDRDGKLILAPFPCFSHAIESKLETGVYTFSVQSYNESEDPPLGPSAVSTASFRVAEIEPLPGYQCREILCGRLKAFVSDEDGRPAWAAKPGTRLNSITLKGGFGERHTAVTLTFYEKNERAAKRAKRKGKRLSKSERLTALAAFEPFVLNLERDAKAKLTLAVPRRYKPTHLGIQLHKLRRRRLTKQQLRVCQARSDTPSLCSYSKVGRCAKSKRENRNCYGDLKKIKAAPLLHSIVKGKRGGKGKRGKGKRAHTAAAAAGGGHARVAHREVTLVPVP